MIQKAHIIGKIKNWKIRLLEQTIKQKTFDEIN